MRPQIPGSFGEFGKLQKRKVGDYNGLHGGGGLFGHGETVKK